MNRRWRALLASAALVAVVGMGLSPAARGATVTVSAIAAGGLHTCALKTNGTVWCWGWAEYGQLGDGTTGDANDERLNPVQVKQGSGKLTGAKAIATGGSHTCALKTDTTVWCWGSNWYGELGNGMAGDRLKPVQVKQGNGKLTGAKAIAAGDSHTCALKTNGTAWCWGYGVFGQLGDGTRGNRSKPVQVKQGSGKLSGAKAIAAGGGHTCALKTNGTVWCWGDAFMGQVGDGTTGDVNGNRLKPVQVQQGAKAIATGEEHTCALKINGTVWCWGAADSGQLGDGTTGNANGVRLRPVQVLKGSGKLSDAKAIAAGGDHTCALKTNGTVWCWGLADEGQLGDGTQGDADGMRLKPVQVKPGYGKRTDWKGIAAGGWHTCALNTNGTAWCWGDAGHGQVGYGLTWDSWTPVEVQFTP